MACWLLPHWRSTVVPGTVSGNPAPSSALRAMLTAWSPTWVTAPAMTSSICDGVDAGALDEFAQAVGEQVGRQHVVQRAVGLALADGGAYRADDDGVAVRISGHGFLRTRLSIACCTQILSPGYS